MESELNNITVETKCRNCNSAVRVPGLHEVLMEGGILTTYVDSCEDCPVPEQPIPEEESQTR